MNIKTWWWRRQKTTVLAGHCITSWSLVELNFHFHSNLHNHSRLEVRVVFSRSWNKKGDRYLQSRSSVSYDVRFLSSWHLKVKRQVFFLPFFWIFQKVREARVPGCVYVFNGPASELSVMTESASFLWSADVYLIYLKHSCAHESFHKYAADFSVQKRWVARDNEAREA